RPLRKLWMIVHFIKSFVQWIDRFYTIRSWACRTIRLRQVEESLLKHWHQKRIEAFANSYTASLGPHETFGLDTYTTLERFVMRNHELKARAIMGKKNGKRAIVVADSRVETYDCVSESEAFWIQGHEYTLSDLIMDDAIAARYCNTAVAVFRLSPCDCHLFHCPVQGMVDEFRSLHSNGKHSQHLVRSAFVTIKTLEFLHMLFIVIDATDEPSVHIHDQWQKRGALVTKGEELGLSKSTGLTIIVAFQPGRIQFDDDLRASSQNRRQTVVELGQSLGKLSSEVAIFSNDVKINKIRRDIARSSLQLSPEALRWIESGGG
ncbi:phosphatidylserine decarboxylase, partial [Polyplosphaeria fusca]